MKIKKCKWKMDAKSPVMFMIDDFANVWVDKNENNKLDKGEDWGHFCKESNSMWDILEKNIFTQFPEVKTTLFTVVGKRAPIINGKKKIYSETILQDDKFVDFLNKINKNKNIEIAYHGVTHGITGINRFEFKEEWETFNSLEEAIENIEKGKEILYKAIGEYPKGGKYCGYKYNEFSDRSISQTGFLWWCRHWDAQLEEVKDNSIYNYELDKFYDVVDIPSTIDGSFYSLKDYSKFFSKKYFKTIYKKITEGKTIESLIDHRVKNGQIISIQEHSSPFRADDRIQYPNIVSDLNNLKYIFSYLKRCNLWYATGTEIAEYYLVYKTTSIKVIDENRFTLDIDKNIEGKELTISINRENISSDIITLVTPKENFILNKIGNQYKGTIRVYNHIQYLIQEE
ncbi:TPA: DUF2334 domain-containing protein [Clostridium botulinum]|nr:DUF2334 domain-containing protein [Clostridium botulinum]